MKIVTVIGARPQFIKASVVSPALRAQHGAREYVVHTGQHFDANMSQVFFDQLDMRAPDANLGIGGGPHGEMTGRMLAEVERVLIEQAPDMVLVFGDTNSTLAGALAAAKLHIPVAHVEAGLRSFNRRMPEEINRVLTDVISSLLFAPTDTAVANLRREGVEEERIRKVGDVMFDAAIQHGERAESLSNAVIDRLKIRGKPYALATIHRAENCDEAARLEIIVRALALVSAEMPVVWPVHPRTRPLLDSMQALHGARRNLFLVEPQSYLDMVLLEKHAAVIATDSGGVQKEAFFHRVPCITLREETEWVELVDAGWNRLAPPTNAEAVCAAILGGVGTLGADARPYGDGRAARQIAETITGTALSGPASRA